MPGAVNDATALTQSLLDGSAAPYDIAVMPTDLVGVPIDNAAASGPQLLMAATVGQRARLYRLWLQVDGATTITFVDGVAGTTQALTIKCPGAQTIKLDLGALPWAQSSINTAFFISTSNAVQITGCAYIGMSAS